MLAVKFYPLITDDLERLAEAGEVLDAGYIFCLNKLYGEQIIAGTHGVYLAALGKDVSRAVLSHSILILRKFSVYAFLQLRAQFLICVTGRV